MTKFKIDNIIAREILDSRGFPTLEVELFAGFLTSRVSVPSGASCGAHEAPELRDCDPNRFHGRGVQKALQYAMEYGKRLVEGIDIYDQGTLDQNLLTFNAERGGVGSNTTLAISLCVAKLAAQKLGLPTYSYINNLCAQIGFKVAPAMPTPYVNVLNGGMHASNKLAFQEFMIVPEGHIKFAEKIRICAEVFHTLKKILSVNGLSTSIGDEGGFAPDLEDAKQALTFLIKAIEDSSYKLQENFTLALDVAASSFFKKSSYNLENTTLNSQELCDYLIMLVKDYPISSIEDPLSEDDIWGWKYLTEKLRFSNVQIVGDDLFATNSERLLYGIQNNLANSILIKPNQIGTLTKTLEAIKLARDNNYGYMVSHRSGETEDTMLAHIAVGAGGGKIKTGSVSRGERTAKYNELLRIEEDLERARN